ncbi:MAG: hypothetical protein JWP01_2811 [Myxococcales bacterium]|nr:hypothetical protein [Myxococcales bacterium]
MFRVRFGLVLALLGCSGDATTVDAAITIDAEVPIDVEDGTPVRRPCTGNLGSGLSRSFGRLDGILVAIVPPGNGGCNADPDHVHLQIESRGDVYDVAINVGSSGTANDVHTATFDKKLPGPVWSDGWKTGSSIDYAQMGVRKADLPLKTRAEIVADLMRDLSTVNHISVFAIGYGPEGAHLVHRNDFGRDGLLITEPLSTPAKLRLFAFADQSF